MYVYKTYVWNANFDIDNYNCHTIHNGACVMCIYDIGSGTTIIYHFLQYNRYNKLPFVIKSYDRRTEIA